MTQNTLKHVFYFTLCNWRLILPEQIRSYFIWGERIHVQKRIKIVLTCNDPSSLLAGPEPIRWAGAIKQENGWPSTWTTQDFTFIQPQNFLINTTFTNFIMKEQKTFGFYLKFVDTWHLSIIFLHILNSVLQREIHATVDK